MYFPVGWPKILSLPAAGDRDEEVLQVAFDREKFLFAIVTRQTLGIWFSNVSRPVVVDSRVVDAYLSLF